MPPIAPPERPSSLGEDGGDVGVADADADADADAGVLVGVADAAPGVVEVKASNDAWLIVYEAAEGLARLSALKVSLSLVLFKKRTGFGLVL
jgi:hypothetical protein